MTEETLTETTLALALAMSETLADTLGTETIECYAINTGGGCMVLACDLSQDGRMIGRQAWLTRENDWILGLYDYASDPEDQGVCVQLLLSDHDSDDPYAVAAQVAAILVRLGVTQLQGA